MLVVDNQPNRYVHKNYKTDDAYIHAPPTCPWCVKEKHESMVEVVMTGRESYFRCAAHGTEWPREKVLKGS